MHHQTKKKIDRINYEKSVLFDLLSERIDPKNQWLIDRIKEWEDEIELIYNQSPKSQSMV